MTDSNTATVVTHTTYSASEMTENTVKAAFLDAGFRVEAIYTMFNQYWPEVDQYNDIREPWMCVHTEFGAIMIGPRKRVYVIDWSMTNLHVEGKKVINDSETRITHTSQMVHSWSWADTRKYLRHLHNYLTDATEDKLTNEYTIRYGSDCDLEKIDNE